MRKPTDADLDLVVTKDGSQTILNMELGSTYHSRHGALTESEHVFLKEGLFRYIKDGTQELCILEMGFGTGLNALLTWTIANELGLDVDYHGLELYPVPEAVWSAYQLPEQLQSQRQNYESIHAAEWNKCVVMDTNFGLTKHQVSLLDFKTDIRFNVVYFDAFEPETQPELWTEEVFRNLFELMKPEAILTTYCCKGYVRRNMISAGFVVEKVPGPPGKREMIVAQRPL